MNPIYKKLIEKPIFLLLTVNILIGLFIHSDFGLTWDEPLFYSYGDALGYAYSPAEWFSGNFDLYNSYGASAEDHKTRGPAYLLLARNFVYGLKALGSDSPSAWHLVNFLFFQLGIYFLYRLSKRWMSTSAAFFAATFFSFQPVLWGHAFINPKDPPFLTFFLAAICLGFEMVDAIAQNSDDRTRKILLAAFVLGIATSIRILAPLAGLLVFIYFLASIKSYRNLNAWRSFIYYGLTAILVMVATWPFLWESLFKNFLNVFILMSDNPTNLAVLFDGVKYSASELPRRYLPVIMSITLTEPTWILFGLGFIAGYWKLLRNRTSDFTRQFTSLSLVFSYFVLVLAYVLIRKPAMYDGMRHFFFILPTIFIFAGFGFEFIINTLEALSRSRAWLHACLGFLLILPGINGIIKLHPYEYAYYNSFVGGRDGAFRSYETDYWLTCYKEAVEEINDKINTPIRLFVYRQASVASSYVDDQIDLQDMRKEHKKIRPGDLILVSTRTNEDLLIHNDDPIVGEVRRGDAIFCVIRRAP
jgi:hypothetical protein